MCLLRIRVKANVMIRTRKEFFLRELILFDNWGILCEVENALPPPLSWPEWF